MKTVVLITAVAVLLAGCVVKPNSSRSGQISPTGTYYLTPPSIGYTESNYPQGASAPPGYHHPKKPHWFKDQD